MTNSNEKIEIVSGKPFPGSGKNKYPWDRLEVDQSFQFLSDIKENSAYGMASVASKRLGKKFKARKMPDGMWCWRVA